MSKRLFLFTATFPFGNAETFLEDEILVLSSYFEEIRILPLSGTNKPVRVVPANCIVDKPVIEYTYTHYLPDIIFSKAWTIYLKDFRKNRVFLNRKRFKAWCISFIHASIALHSKQVKKIFSNLSSQDVCYYYWGKGLNVLSVFDHSGAKHVSRFHGEWDLWEESCGGYAPIRRSIADSLNSAIFISRKGERYFANKYPSCKTVFSPLGSYDYGFSRHDENNTSLRVVSCSSVYPLKRVPLIYEALNSMTDLRIEWTHIGGGIDFENLKELCIPAKPHLSITLTDNVSHQEVIAYYKTHTFDLFVNLSENEGVPVSIMEAISFDIPIVATNVGGTSEVVSNEVGILISSNPSIIEVTNAIKEVARGKFSPRLFWDKHYNGEKNYTSFAQYLKSL